MVVAGITSGVGGGVAFYDSRSCQLCCFETPIEQVSKVKRVSGAILSEILIEHKPEHVFLEKMMSKANFKTPLSAINHGIMLGTVQALKFPLTEVPINEWSKAMRLGADKLEYLTRARALFPNNLEDFQLKKSLGVAGASMLSLYGFREVGGGEIRLVS